MPIAKLGTLSVISTGGAVNSYTISSHRVEPGRNRCLLVWVTETGSKNVTGVTVAGNNATALSSVDNNARSGWAYYYLNPSVGTPSIVVNLSSTSNETARIYILTLYDVSQTTPFGTAATHSPVSPSTGVSANVTCVVGDLVLGLCAAGRQPTVGSGETLLGSYTDIVGGAISYKTAGATTETIDFTWSSVSQPAALVAFAVNGDETGSLPDIAVPDHAAGRKTWVLGTDVRGETFDIANATSYPGTSAANDGTAANAGMIPWPYSDLTLAIHEVYVRTNTASASSTSTVQTGSTDIDVLTIGAGATGKFTASPAYALPNPWDANELFTKGGTGSVIVPAFSYVVESGAGDPVLTLLQWHSDGQPKLNSATTYSAMPHGSKDFVVASSTAMTMPADLTLRNCRVGWITSTRTHTTDWKLQKNGVDTSFVFSWSNSDNTQWKEDTTNTVTVVRGDTLNVQAITGAGTGQSEFNAWGVFAESTNGEFLLTAAKSSATSFAANATVYVPISGELHSRSTESEATYDAPFPFTALRLWVEVSSNTMTFGAGTVGNINVVVRKNGADTDLKVSIARGDERRYFIDLYNKVKFETGDDIAIKVDASGAGSSDIKIRAIGVVAVSETDSTVYTQSISGAISAVGALTKSIYRVLSGTFTQSGSLVANVSLSQSFSGVVTMSGALLTAATYVRSYASQIISSGSLNAAFSGIYLQALAGTITAVGAVSKNVSRFIGRSVTLTNTLYKDITRTLSSTLTGVGSVSGFQFVPTVGGLVNRGMRFMRRFIGRR